MENHPSVLRRGRNLNWVGLGRLYNRVKIKFQLGRGGGQGEQGEVFVVDYSKVIQKDD